MVAIRRVLYRRYVAGYVLLNSFVLMHGKRFEYFTRNIGIYIILHCAVFASRRVEYRGLLTIPRVFPIVSLWWSFRNPRVLARDC